MNIKRLAVLGFMIALLSVVGFTAQVHAATFGDKMVVHYISDIPENWVMVGTIAPFVDKSNPNYTGENDYTIMYVGGANFGDTVDIVMSHVIGEQYKIPSGWEVIESSRTLLGILCKIQYKVVATPTPVTELPKQDNGLRLKYGDIIEVESNLSFSQKDYLVQLPNLVNTYKYIGNAGYGTIEETDTDYIPREWIGIEYNKDLSRITKIKCVSNAKIGDVEYAVIHRNQWGRFNEGDYYLSNEYFIPEGWIVTQYDETTLKAALRYIGNENDIAKQYKFGDKISCAYIPDMKFPKNWVPINENSIMYIGGNPSFGTVVELYLEQNETNSPDWIWKEFGKKIQYIGNTKYGDEVEIDVLSYYSCEGTDRALKAIPDGWAFVSLKGQYDSKSIIKCLKGASYGNQLNVSIFYAYNPNFDYCSIDKKYTKNSLPNGWVVTDYDKENLSCTIEYILGAPYKTQLTLRNLMGTKHGYGGASYPMKEMKPPCGWIVTSVGEENYVITCLEGASYGDEEYGYVDLCFDWYKTGLPEGWIFASKVDDLNRVKVRYIKGAPLGTKEKAYKFACNYDYFWDLLPSGWVDTSSGNEDAQTLTYIGDEYPELGQNVDSTLKDENGKEVMLHDFKGKNSVLCLDYEDSDLTTMMNECPGVQFFSITDNEEFTKDYCKNMMLKDAENKFAFEYAGLKSFDGTWTRTTFYTPTYLFVDKDLKLVSKKIRISEAEAIEEAKRLFGAETEIVVTQPATNPIKSCDLNNDGVINMMDIMKLATAFSTVLGDERYVSAYDLNKDNSINMADVILMATNFNKIISDVEGTI